MLIGVGDGGITIKEPELPQRVKRQLPIHSGFAEHVQRVVAVKDHLIVQLKTEVFVFQVLFGGLGNLLSLMSKFLLDFQLLLIH